jgi:peptidoglycan/LPS O-acetylase OafA/YrhL
VSNFLIAKEQRWDALPYFSHFWSLSVEEHFYFLWPFLVARSGPRSLAQWAIGLIVLALGLRVGLAAAGVNELVAYTITPAKLDGLCLGGLLALWVRRPDGLAQLSRWAPRLSAGVLAYLFVGYAVAHRISPRAHAIYFEGRETGVVLLFGALLVSVLKAPRRSLLTKFFTSRLLVTLGKYSYGLYVFHAFLSWYLLRARTEDTLASAVGSHTLAVFIQATVGVAASLAVAYVSYHLFEKRFLALKSRFEAKRREPVAG